jgi:hypothetical protein
MSSPATLVKKAAARKNRLAVGRRVIMSDFGERIKREINKQKFKQKKKQQGVTNANLNLSQFRLSVKAPMVYPMVDNDGKNIFPEPRGYTKFGGH